MRATAGVILAAGGSSRLGRPKQLIPFRGQSLLRRMVEAASGCSPVIVVIGSDTEMMKAELTGTNATLVENEDWQLGIGTSIRAGVQRAMEENVDSVLLLTCDQPFVDAETLARIVRLRERTGKSIVASAYSGTLGIPALFDRACFAELLALSGDNGAKGVILSDRNRIAEFPFAKASFDIDTVADYERLLSEK